MIINVELDPDIERMLTIQACLERTSKRMLVKRIITDYILSQNQDSGISTLRERLSVMENKKQFEGMSEARKELNERLEYIAQEEIKEDEAKIDKIENWIHDKCNKDRKLPWMLVPASAKYKEVYKDYI